MSINSFVGSYLGFMFDDFHSSDLGLVRTSDGTRYTENFLPDFQDRTAQPAGGDGTFYYGTTFSKRNFTINVAFESLTDGQIRQMKRMFSDRKLHRLIFDETPYKYYWVKCSSSPVFKMLAFDTYLDLDGREVFPSKYQNKEDLYGTVSPEQYEGIMRTNVTGRVYKGEATLNFVAYDPFAYSYLKFIDEYTIETVPAWGKYDYITDTPVSTLDEWGALINFAEWRDSVNLIRSDFQGRANGTGDNYAIDKVNHSGSHIKNKNVLVYNPGDFYTPYKLIFMYAPNGASGQGGKLLPEDCQAGAHIPRIRYKFYDGVDFPDWYTDTPPLLEVSDFVLDSGDYGFQINTKLHLIEGLDNYGNLTGKIYNKYIIAGDFFDIPINDDSKNCLVLNPVRLNKNGETADGGDHGDSNGAVFSELWGRIDYSYLYY